MKEGLKGVRGEEYWRCVFGGARGEVWEEFKGEGGRRIGEIWRTGMEVR